MTRRPPETTRLIRGRSPHTSFAVHMRELVGRKKKHFVYWSRRKWNNFFLKQERVSELITLLGREFQVFGPWKRIVQIILHWFCKHEGGNPWLSIQYALQGIAQIKSPSSTC